MGRKSTYTAAVPEAARKICLLGATDAEIADFFGISINCFYVWRLAHPEFAESLRIGKEEADARVERSLYHRSVGYTYTTEKVILVPQGGGGGSAVERIEVKEHIPPDIKAIMFWLQNRKRDVWQNRKEHEHSGPGGGPIQTLDLSDMNTNERDKLRELLELRAKTSEADS